MQKRRPVVLCILDGWGARPRARPTPSRPGAARRISTGSGPAPRGSSAHGRRDVGLPDGQMGNSEVGHMNIGAGRVVMQDLPRIDDAIADGELAPTPALTNLIAAAEGEQRHLPPHGPGVARRRAFAPGPRRGAPRRSSPTPACRCCVHAFLDGRDTPPQSAAADRRRSTRRCRGRAHRHGQRALLRHGPRQALGAGREGLRSHRRCRGPRFPDAPAGDRRRLRQQETRRVHPADGHRRLHGMRDGDGVLCFNFRADRAREILAALLDPEFDGFARGAPCARRPPSA